MSLPARILALLLALLVAFAAGWGAAVRKAARDALQDQLAAERGARVIEAQETRRAARNADALLQDRVRGERAAADAAIRLRDLAASAPHSAAACTSGDLAAAAPAWVLRGSTRADLIEYGREVERLASGLRACQRDLIKPAMPPSAD